ncbi:hypothetical protein J7I91_20215 [Pseudomonas sp. ISL-84]|nr:hypothetical protein [Pseudomonas sp. ISL-84]
MQQGFGITSGSMFLEWNSTGHFNRGKKLTKLAIPPSIFPKVVSYIHSAIGETGQKDWPISLK